MVQKAVAGFVDIRGEKKGFPEGEGGPADAEQEKQAYAIEEMGKIFPGVVTLPDLAKVLTNFGQKVNAVVRSAITKEMQALDQSRISRKRRSPIIGPDPISAARARPASRYPRPGTGPPARLRSPRTPRSVMRPVTSRAGVTSKA